MNKNKLEKIIKQAIEGNELPFDRFLKDLFKQLKPKLLSLTQSPQEVEDIFIASMQKFWERFVVNQEKLPENSIGYIFVMCKNNWLISKRHPWNSVVLKEAISEDHKFNDQNNTNIDNSIENLEVEWTQKRALSEALDSLSEKCKTLMESEINPEIKLKDLQQQLEFQNYQALAQAKYNCKKRLIKKVYEIFDQLTVNKKH
ncbi:hypothetical protein [Aquimarina sp. 2201CG5-10]|uniref:RNA polymerase sigma factor n=1 Tax=Aquimarina callyspongiae TaxID=3098150 RepID=UPI002AB572F6|nr:hypothetical protein [Aquimarina sp. 2201CG5-10]MDY8136933.1 hypothetical protein [Aquimarina sp. 2201CG5-10]